MVGCWGLFFGVVATFLGGVGFCTQRNTTSPLRGDAGHFSLRSAAKKTNEKVGWLLGAFIGGFRYFFERCLFLHPKEYDIPPAGGRRSLFFAFGKEN